MTHKCVVSVETNLVVNVIVLEDSAVWTPPQNTFVLSRGDGKIGDTWDGEKFISPLTEEQIALNTTQGEAPNVIG